MHFLAIVIIGIAANLDNLCVGMAYSMSGKRISLTNNIIISSVSGVLSGISCAVANSLGQANLSIAKTVGAVLLILVGLYTLYDVLAHPCEEAKAEKKSGFFDMLILGIILAVNGIASALGAGLFETASIPLGISIAVFSFIAISVGSAVSRRVKYCSWQKWLSIAGALLLIGIGIWEVFI